MPKILPCSVCGAKLKPKRTVRGETVYDHPRNGCKWEWMRVRKHTIDEWNRMVQSGTA